ncbi:MAG: endonuclease III [Nanoarchaeota archaeon]|nr:endonuclease III [Nanoarchaeota archaeon]MBU1102940.1 endonuclease III [Nanoarchaeota archaeon]
MKILLKEFKPYAKPTVRQTSETKNPFKTLISCLLSLRTQDKNTAKASASLFKVANTPEEIAKLPIKKLEKLIFSSGHYKKKARTLKHVSQILIKKYNSKVPKTKETLLSIKGIGPKTANIVLSFAYEKNVIAVDTHVHRIPNRLGLVKTKTPEQTEIELMKIFPKKYWKEINTTLILFGKNICVPISPKCSTCPIKKLCQRVGVERSR